MTVPNEQTKIIERDLWRIGELQDKLQQRFDRHLEIYAQNGKELSAVKVEVQNLVKSLDEVTREQAQNNKEISRLKIEMGKIGVKVSAWAAAGAAASSAVVVYLIEKLLT